MKKGKELKKLKAFSMNEVLVVLVIVGILSTIAISSMGDLVGDAYRTEAESNLNMIKTRQEYYHMKKFEYSTDLNKIGFNPPKKEKDGGQSVYTYEVIEADKTTFTAQATADKDFDGDGIYEVLILRHEGPIQVKVED